MTTLNFPYVLPTDRRNLDGIHEAIDSFNEQSKLGSIEIRALHPPTGWRLFAFSIPFTGVIQLVFYSLDTPVQLRRGLVPLYAYLADEDGAGFNYILIRKGTGDTYGEWQICKIGISGFADPRKYPRPFVDE